jgi:GNAT superfamily N-acetyltransferase
LGNRVVGAAIGTFRSRLNWPTRELWIADLIVTDSARGYGAGHTLMDEAIAQARQAGCHRVVLESGHQRKIAHQLYQSLGFQDRGVYFALDL